MCQNLVLKQCGSRAFAVKAGALAYSTHSYWTSMIFPFVSKWALVLVIDAIPNRSTCRFKMRSCISFDGMCLICCDGWTCWSWGFVLDWSFLTHTDFWDSLFWWFATIFTFVDVVTCSFFLHICNMGWFSLVRLFDWFCLLGCFCLCLWSTMSLHSFFFGTQIQVFPW